MPLLSVNKIDGNKSKKHNWRIYNIIYNNKNEKENSSSIESLYDDIRVKLLKKSIADRYFFQENLIFYR